MAIVDQNTQGDNNLNTGASLLNADDLRSVGRSDTGSQGALLGKGARFEGKLTFEGTVDTDGDGTGGFTSDDVIVEARLGPLGFVGEFDHTGPANGVTYRDARTTLPDGSPNPDQSFFTLPSPMPQDWEFG